MIVEQWIWLNSPAHRDYLLQENVGHFKRNQVQHNIL